MKKVLLSVLGAAMIFGGTTGSVFASSDTPERADQIYTSPTNKGWVGDGDLDYWFFIPDETGMYRFTLDRLEGDADLYLLDENENELDRSANDGSANEEIYQRLKSGKKYYIKIKGYASTDYRLDVDKR